MAAKISTLVLKVDLSCPKCYNKIRQVLCKFSCQIQSKTFDEKNNTVTITGYFYPCCKFSKKLCRKAGKVIQSIEIKNPEPKSEPQPNNPPPAVPPTVVPQPEPTPQEPNNPPPAVPPTVVPQPEPTPQEPAPKEREAESQPKIIVPYFIPDYRPPQHFGGCCGPCYEGFGGGPCHHQGYEMQPLFPPYYDYYGERPPPPPPPCSCGCGGYWRCSSPCEYFSDENPDTCTIM